MSAAEGNVNCELLKQHVQKFKFSKESCAEFHKQLFTRYPEVAVYWDAEDLNPESLVKSHKFVNMGQRELRYLFMLATEYKCGWRSMLYTVVEYYTEEVPQLNFDKDSPKLTEALIGTLEKVTGECTDEQRKQWTALMEQAVRDMKKFEFIK